MGFANKLITKHHLRRELSAIFLTACMVLNIGVHSVCTAVRNYYEIVCYLASGDEIFTLIKI